jgi:hypothetical protein
VYNRCPLKCEVKRKTDGRDTLQKYVCEGVGIGELGGSYKKTSNYIYIIP